MGQVSGDSKMLLSGFVLILSSLVFFKLPWEFLRIYEFIKDDKALLKRYKILRTFYGSICLIVGVFIVLRMAFKFLLG